MPLSKHEVIEVFHLYAMNGSDTGFGHTLGYYVDRASAEQAGRSICPGHWDIDEGVPALRLSTGEVFLMRQPEPVKLEGVRS
jgi:hypothetical protein